MWWEDQGDEAPRSSTTAVCTPVIGISHRAEHHRHLGDGTPTDAREPALCCHPSLAITFAIFPSLFRGRSVSLYSELRNLLQRENLRLTHPEGPAASCNYHRNGLPQRPPGRAKLGVEATILARQPGWAYTRDLDTSAVFPRRFFDLTGTSLAPLLSRLGPPRSIPDVGKRFMLLVSSIPSLYLHSPLTRIRILCRRLDVQLRR